SRKYIVLEEESKSIFEFITLSFILNSSRTITRHTINEDIRYAVCYFKLAIILVCFVMVKKIFRYFRKCEIRKVHMIDILKVSKKTSSGEERIIKDYRFNMIGILRILLVLYIMLSLSNYLSNNPYGTLKETISCVGTELYNPKSMDDFSNDIYNRSLELKAILDKTLSDDETFFDFANYTGIYSYVNRYNPVYENQCPAHINGIEGQMFVLNDLIKKREQIPLVLMRSQGSGLTKMLDGILNIDRYYLITEYIYQNYRPYYIDRNYELWCLNERYDDMLDLIEKNERDIRDSYEDCTHYLGAIPFLWANYDKEVIREDKLINIKGLPEIKRKENPYYLILKVNSDDEREAVIEVRYANGSKEKYRFNLMKGTHYYKIRISTDYDWIVSHIDDLITEEGFTDKPEIYLCIAN
nr:hypothetical protein [Lachnospiraceae bacterium]